MAEDEILEEENAGESVGQFDEFIKLPSNLSSIYSGYIVEFKENYVKTRFQSIHDMMYDEEQLSYSGFTYMAANYAALLAVNNEFAITIGSKISFLAPVQVGDEIEFEARAYFNESKKREVRINGAIGGVKVLEGTFQVIVLEDHIFKIQKKEAERQRKESALERAKAAKEEAMKKEEK